MLNPRVYTQGFTKKYTLDEFAEHEQDEENTAETTHETTDAK